MTVKSCLLLISAALLPYPTLAQSSAPSTHKPAVSQKSSAPRNVMHYEISPILSVKFHIKIEPKSLTPALKVPDYGVVILTLVEVYEVGKDGIDRPNVSVTLVKGETKRLPLFSLGSPPLLSCEVLVTMGTSGDLALGPLPPSAGSTCGDVGNIGLNFRALILSPQL